MVSVEVINKIHYVLDQIVNVLWMYLKLENFNQELVIDFLVKII